MGRPSPPTPKWEQISIRLAEDFVGPRKGHEMDVYQAVEHFDEEVGLNLLIDSTFGDEGADGAFPLSNGTEGSKQALAYTDYGVWFITQAPRGSGTEDHIRYFPFDVVTSCSLRQAEGARSVFQDHETSFPERMSEVLRATTLEMTIADAAFEFSGSEIAQLLRNEAFYAEVLDSFFALVHRCASYGVPVELVSSPSRILVGANS